VPRAAHAVAFVYMRVLTPSKAESALLAPFIGLELSQIYVPVTVADFSAATAEIMAAGVVGFDTESKPIFDRGVVSDGPHVVQFALASRAYIFQLHHAISRDFLLAIFASDEVLKVGFGLRSDHREIRAKLGVTPQSVLDLNDIFRKLGHRGTTGARAAIAIVLNQKFHKSKAVTTSNWAQPVLTPKQLLYAANDAYAALRVLMALELSPDELASYR
jgi:ribonuclease D